VIPLTQRQQAIVAYVQALTVSGEIRPGMKASEIGAKAVSAFAVDLASLVQRMGANRAATILEQFAGILRGA
jgi:hypothetical protein